METKEYRTVNKSAWPHRGEWDHEPDKMQWTDEATGLPCLIVRGPSGALCGYVGVANKHPYFEKHYDSCDVDVHGGLTFSSKCQKVKDESCGICHAVSDGEDDNIWWLGFDCAHFGDVCPRYDKSFGDEQYKNVSFVQSEIRSLAKQLESIR
jgi:hypothetical protein